MSKGQQLYARARHRIPGATQLLGKRAEMYLPEQWPAYYSQCKGCEVWDLDGNRYLDFTMVGIGTSVLGYADPEVEQAVIAAVRAGTMCTLNCPEDVELAELLCELHPWSDQVSYARTGGEIMAKAVRIARACTGKSKIAFCGYHGWHDWYLAVNLGHSDGLASHLLPGLEPVGVPRELSGTMLPFSYNRINELKQIIDVHGSELAAICIETVRGAGPEEGFLKNVSTLAKQIGAVLIFDEITSGFRLFTGGAHMTYGVHPDLCTFAKTMSNGVPMAAVIGNRSVMDAANSTFMSSAYWTEKAGPAAAIATIRKHRRVNAASTLHHIGHAVQEGWKKAASEVGLQIEVSGIYPLSSFSFNVEDPAPYLTLFIQELLERGFLASDRFYPTIAHQPSHIDAYLNATHDAFGLIADSIRKGDVIQRLKGPVKHMGFARLA